VIPVGKLKSCILPGTDSMAVELVQEIGKTLLFVNHKPVNRIWNKSFSKEVEGIYYCAFI
jgi:hypothetical protein